MLQLKWQKVEEADRGLAPFRDASLDRWHRKTMLSAGNAAMRSNLRALNQSVSQQVAALMANPAKLLQRTQLVRWAPGSLTAAPPTAGLPDSKLCLVLGLLRYV